MAAHSNANLRMAYLLCFYSGVVIVVLGLVLLAQNGNEYSATLFILGLGLVVAGNVCAAFLLYRSWRCVERHRERLPRGKRVVEPGAAVALTFIPIVNAIGVYLSLGPLPGMLNELAGLAGSPKRAPATLGYIAAVLITCAWIPIIGLVFGVIAILAPVPILLTSASAVADDIDARLDLA
jgi:hypothetical protein